MAAKDLVDISIEGLTFSMTPEVHVLLRSGELDPDVAYMQGKLKITGDMVRFYDLLPLAGADELRAALQLP
jgi:predicted lipid carrier protein YhbT